MAIKSMYLAVGVLMARFVMSGASADPMELAEPSWVPPVSEGIAVKVGTLSVPAITEASGMAYSRARRDVLWIANDSGNAAELFAVSTVGVLEGVVPVDGVENRDWEDMAAFCLDGTAYLLIAEIGDNAARHDTCALLIVADPLPAEGPVRLPASLTPAWTVTFRYPDGPRDCEAVAVDESRRRVLLLSKRDEPPVYYELPLRPPEGVGIVEAERLGELRTIPAPSEQELTDEFGRFWAQPTGMDLGDDGSLVVLTYKHAYRYSRLQHEDWDTAFRRPPSVLRLPHPATGIMRMREAIAIDPESGEVYVTSEGSPSPLYRGTPAAAAR